MTAKASVELLSILARYLHGMVYTRVGGWRFRWARICHPCADDRQVIKTVCFKGNCAIDKVAVVYWSHAYIFFKDGKYNT
jgi:hypothetical protein